MSAGVGVGWEGYGMGTATGWVRFGWGGYCGWRKAKGGVRFGCGVGGSECLVGDYVGLGFGLGYSVGVGYDWR